MDRPSSTPFTRPIGHLGIFVSAGVARKEHGEFSSNIDLIDTLPPGLYEAMFTAKAESGANPELATGNWVMRCEARTLDDIRALGGNDAEDERRFATAARVSEINLALYRAFAQPVVRAMATESSADWMRQCHPLRLQYELFSDREPVHGPGQRLGGAGSRQPKAGGGGQSVPCDAGERVAPDRRGARRLARRQ